jgi:hypothetical protein
MKGHYALVCVLLLLLLVVLVLVLRAWLPVGAATYQLTTSVMMLCGRMCSCYQGTD